MDSSETSKLLAARISQLEVDNAAEKEQEAEIEREVRKHTRDLNNSLNSSSGKMNDIEKIDLLTKRWSELFAQMKRHERDSIKNKKRADQLQKDKDSSRTEASKLTGLKEKLEKLCRELQKDNNKLKGEQRSLKDAHDKLRKDSDKRMEEVFKTLEGYQEEKDNPRKQVMNTKVEDLFKNRFKSLIEQYELRELHYHSLMRTKEIEVQWNMARYEQQKKAAESESARCRQLNSQVLTFSKTETELRNQLNVYVDKFKQASSDLSSLLLNQALGLTLNSSAVLQVEDTLNNSNDLFLTFRKEMEDMSKKTKKLEKENETLKRKVEARNQNIVKMADERQKHVKELDDIRKKNEKLTSIINQMQQQGRGIPQGMQGTVEDSCYAEGEEVHDDGGDELEDEEGDEESEYEYEEEEGDFGSEEVEFDDDTEEEVHLHSLPPVQAPTAPTYGPEPPPTHPAAQAAAAAATAPAINGHR
ncbi:hypothetical protein PG997_014310 [Apiospora hydei]|uniref:Alpha-taxilin n=1 Tax=Apiospora hydei TaxID=1337664 RepID=A0ABR1UTF2_9PEZI